MAQRAAAPVATLRIPELDRVVHEPARLGILSVLSTRRQLTFTELRDLLEMTDGNLSVHLRTLEEAGHVSVKKTFDQRKPRTTVKLTARGREALSRYLDALEGILRATRDR